jgi:hypothetical protein
METIKSNGAVTDNAKMSEKWFTEANNAMMEIYNKQINLASGIYSNLLNSTLGNSKNWSGNSFSNDNMLSNSFSKLFWNPANNFSGVNNSTNLFSSFDKMYKQLLESNHHFLNEYSNQIKNSENDWNTINKEYKDTFDRRVESSRKILTTISEVYNKQFNFALDSEKSLFEEMHNQLNMLMKQNQKWWKDALEKAETASEAEDKKSKEPYAYENKKRATIPVVA